MSLRVLVERREDDREDDSDVVSHEVDDVLVVPVVESPLGDLEVLRVDAPRELLEQRHLDLLELDRLDHVQDLLYLVQVHDLLRTVDLGPVSKQTEENLLREGRVLLEELDDAVGELRMVESEGFGFVERDESSSEEGLVFFLERESESVDDGSEDFEEFGDSVVSFGLVDELEEDVVDGSTDEGSEIEEATIDSMKGRLEEVSFSGILAVEEFEELEGKGGGRVSSSLFLERPSSPQVDLPLPSRLLQRRPESEEERNETHLKDERLIDVLLRRVHVEVRALNEPKKELVDDLKMRPRELQDGLVLLGVEGVSCRVDLRRDGSEEVGGELERTRRERNEGQLLLEGERTEARSVRRF